MLDVMATVIHSLGKRNSITQNKKVHHTHSAFRNILKPDKQITIIFCLDRNKESSINQKVLCMSRLDLGKFPFTIYVSNPATPRIYTLDNEKFDVTVVEIRISCSN